MGRPPKIIWKECPHCGKRYDEGNPLARAAHEGLNCLRCPGTDCKEPTNDE